MSTRPARLAALAGLTLLAWLAGASSALAHAQLLGTSPVAGSTIASQPAQVIFEFNQAVGGTLGAVRVYDAAGNEVDNLAVVHPRGNQRWMGVGLKPHLADGTYTATYRVISADTHIVYGGLVFNLGHAGVSPRYTVAGLIARNRSGRATVLAFGAVRFLDYVSIALFVGALAFLLRAWLPALAAAGGAEPQWREASLAFARRLQRLLVLAIALGFLVSALGFLLQGASAAGLSLWGSLNGVVLEDTLKSRFGQVWASRALVWLLFAALLAGARASRRAPIPVLRPAALGADGLALGPRPARWILALTALGALYLAATPALSGHASVQSPVWAFLPADVVHVLAASVWVGGIACLLLALPAATRRLVPGDRSRLLRAALTRFSPLALAAVAAIAATGTLQAYIEVRSLHGLLHTTYGALLLVKTALLLALACLGWVNRERLIPALQRLAAAGASPGGVGLAARRSLRGEALLALCVFGVTAALITYTPPIDAASGPFSTSARLGPAELELTVEPARTGLNTVHLYLIDARTGSQFTATKELTASARLPAENIGPLPLHANLAGPGHYILSSVVLSPGGEWTLLLSDRVSEFQAYAASVKVPIR